MKALPAETGLNKQNDFSINLKDKILKAQLGDRFAFEDIYRAYIGKVYAICLRMSADPDRAQELTQETFIRIWETINSFRGDSPFSAWLRRVAINVVLVDIRSNRRRSARISSSSNIDCVERGNTDNSMASNMDLESAIATLPPQARAIFILHDMEGYKHEEVAQMMDLAIGTCKAQLHRARKLLQEILKG
jgi:RNA polymerase sigma-70 factor, ECF subfamily